MANATVIEAIEMGDGTAVYITDYGDYPVHSRAVFDAGVAVPPDTYLFNYIEGNIVSGGGAGLNATIADTNMPAVNQFPKGHEMIVYSAQIIPDDFGNPLISARWSGEGNPGRGIRKWQHIFSLGWFELNVEQSKAYISGRLDAFPMGGGFLLEKTNIAGVGTTAAGWYAPFNGDRTWQAIRPLQMPLHLEEMSNWSAKIRFPRGLNIAASNPIRSDWSLTVRLTGLRRRPSL